VVLGLGPPSGGGGGGGGAGSGGGSSGGGGCGDAGLDGEDEAMKYSGGECRWKTSENTKAAANSGEKLAGAAAAQVVWLPPFLSFLDGGRGRLFPHASLSLSASLALAFRFCFLCLFLVCSFSHALYCVFPVGISFRLEVVDDETEGMRVLFFRSCAVGIPCLCFFFFFFFERPCFRYMPTC
jgi:hypothetical protein